MSVRRYGPDIVPFNVAKEIIPDDTDSVFISKYYKGTKDDAMVAPYPTGHSTDVPAGTFFAKKEKKETSKKEKKETSKKKGK